MDLLAFDTETCLIGYHNITPDFVCLQISHLCEGSFDETVFTRVDETTAEMADSLFDETTELVGHNTAYDLCVLAKEYPHLLPKIWEALDAGRIHDTMIREMLYNLTACGDLENISIGGANRRAEYSLAAVTLLHTGVDRSEAKEADDSVRLNYELVKDKPLEDWPDEFVRYAKDDPTDTLKVYLKQADLGRTLKEATGYDPFVTETFRVKVAFALQLMTEHGNLMDTDRVLQITDEFNALYNDPELVNPLVYSRYIEAYAEANELPITKELIKEALDSIPGLPEREQKAWKGGIIIPAVPPQPHANGALDHLETCYGHKSHPDHPKKAVKDCGCPPKMTTGKKEAGSSKTLWNYIWKTGLENEAMEVWASDSLVTLLRREGLNKEFLDGKIINQQAVCEHYESNALPDGWRISTNKEWMASFALVDPLLEIFSTRKKYEKIITSYLPGLYWKPGAHNCPALLEGATSKLEGKEPADVVHCQFGILKKTGRTSSRAAKKGKGKKETYLYPSMNGQQVDPRIRPCVVARPGYALFSLDYSGMELGTTAQTCINLFGFSTLGDVINAGGDSHAYLGTYIARELDPYFRVELANASPQENYDLFKTLEETKDVCTSTFFISTWESLKREGGAFWDRMGHEGPPLWKDYYKYYRTFAKPTGLGYPGGLGPKTFVGYAKGMFGMNVDLKTAYALRDIWKKAYPEMVLYLDYISKRSFDQHNAPVMAEDKEGKKYKRRFYAYDTPLGMHRPKADFCACANGMALQSPSAEGALMAISDIQRDIRGRTDTPISDGPDGEVYVRPTVFIHDEQFGEIKLDDKIDERMQYMSDIMVDRMQQITPDVKASTEGALMYRWSKGAFTYCNDEGKLRPYEEALDRYYYMHPEIGCYWACTKLEKEEEGSGALEISKDDYLELRAEGQAEDMSQDWIKDLIY